MPSHTELRDELERLVTADLLGPANGPEEMADDTHADVEDEVLDRLLRLNQERYEEEARAGLWERKWRGCVTREGSEQGWLL